jgi:hypothetical protein
MKGPFGPVVAIISSLIFFVSCKTDTPKSYPTVTGYWVVASALRDTRETRLLADVFFLFEPDGKMFTNLPNTAETTTDYEVKEDKIIQQSTPIAVYNILSKSDTTMTLNLEINNTAFEIHLKKTTPPLPSPIDSLSKPKNNL